MLQVTLMGMLMLWMFLRLLFSFTLFLCQLRSGWYLYSLALRPQRASALNPLLSFGGARFLINSGSLNLPLPLLNLSVLESGLSNQLMFRFF